MDDEGTIILTLSSTDTIPDINHLVTSEDLPLINESSEDVFISGTGSDDDTDSRYSFYINWMYYLEVKDIKQGFSFHCLKK